MKLKPIQEIDAAIKARMPEIVNDLIMALLAWRILLIMFGRGQDAIDVLPESVKGILFQD